MTFDYTLQIKADGKIEADNKVMALKILEAKLTEKELNKLANIIQNDKATYLAAKMFLKMN